MVSSLKAVNLRNIMILSKIQLQFIPNEIIPNEINETATSHIIYKVSMFLSCNSASNSQIRKKGEINNSAKLDPVSFNWLP